MNCGFLGLNCVTDALRWVTDFPARINEWWMGAGLGVQILVLVSLALIIGGMIWRVVWFVKRIAGWPGVGGLLGLVAAALITLWPSGETKAKIEELKVAPTPKTVTGSKRVVRKLTPFWRR